MVVILYSIIQFLEGYILAPYVMHKAIRLPPAGILIAQILFGILFGLLGLALAIPLFAAVVIIIQQLYIHDTLGEDVELPRKGA
jgi:predicted PurR-regulated permease PerM